MGQRSCVFVRYMDGNEVVVEARWFNWMYGERMVSRARHTIEWIAARNGYSCELKEKLPSIINVNFDMHDVVISYAVNAISIEGTDDGSLLIDVIPPKKEGGKCKYKYCFTNNIEFKPLNGEDYMRFDTECCYDRYKWDNEEYRKSTGYKVTARNLKWLEKHATLMTQEEVNEFIDTPMEIPF